MSDRTVATDALEVLGVPNLGGKQVGRDAIHLAVEPATAGESLGVARSVRREPNGLWYHCSDGERMAIVDPFLASPVREGQRFLAVVPPRQITSLRHVWAHPEFPDEGEQVAAAAEPPRPSLEGVTPAQSEEWLREFARNNDCPNYETLVAVALGDYTNRMDSDYGPHRQFDEEYLHFAGYDAHGEIPEEFWDHLENATGKKPPFRAKYFSCSC